MFLLHPMTLIALFVYSVTDLGMDEDDDEAVPLPNVNAAILKKVIQWCTYHKDDPPPPEDDENKEKRTDDISSWDAEFLKVDQGTLFELILVSTPLSLLPHRLHGWTCAYPSFCVDTSVGLFYWYCKTGKIRFSESI